MMNLPSLRHLWHLTALRDHGHFGRAARGLSRDPIDA